MCKFVLTANVTVAPVVLPTNVCHSRFISDRVYPVLEYHTSVHYVSVTYVLVHAFMSPLMCASSLSGATSVTPVKSVGLPGETTLRSSCS